MKKGQAFSIFNWTFWRIPIIIIVAAAIYILLSNSLFMKLSSYETENIILVNRLLNSPDILAYKDRITGRVYPGIIDSIKFNTETLSAAIVDPNKRIAVNLELTNLNTNDVSRAYINEERAKIWDDYVVIGGFHASSSVRFVKIYDKGNFYPGIIKIKVIEKI